MTHKYLVYFYSKSINRIHRNFNIDPLNLFMNKDCIKNFAKKNLMIALINIYISQFSEFHIAHLKSKRNLKTKFF